MISIRFELNTAQEKDIHNHLEECKNLFEPPLDKRIDLHFYSKKLVDNAYTFEAWDGYTLIGLVACYLNNDEAKEGFITNVSVIEKYHGQKISKSLVNQNITLAKKLGFKRIKLEVNKSNKKAINLYSRLGFYKINSFDNELVSANIYMLFKI